MATPLEAPSTCPVCDRPPSNAYVEFAELRFDECKECGAVFRGPERTPLLPADFYEQGYFHGRKSGRDRRFEHRVKKAQSWISDCLDQHPGATALLDVGCSFGYVLEGARRLGLTASGTDISKYAVERCAQLGFDARVGTVDRLPFDDASFDIVVMKHVLEHTPQPKVALAEVKRVLRPSGRVLIAVPDLDYWKGRWWRRRGRYFKPTELGAQHFVYYDERALARVVEHSGFALAARSKAYFRARRGSWWERARWLGLALWQSLARGLHLRRELYFIGARPSA